MDHRLRPASANEGWSSTSGGSPGKGSLVAQTYPAIMQHAPTGSGGDAQPSNQTANGFLKAVRDTFVHRDEGGELRQTTIIVRADMVVRGQPAPADASFDDYCYVSTAGEVFGWIERAALDPVPAELVPASDAQLGEGTPKPESEMPSIGADEYDDLVILNAETPVFSAPDTTSEQVATGTQMETVVVLQEPTDEVAWRQVRLLRTPPISGWINAPEATSIDRGAAIPTGTWRSGYRFENADRPGGRALTPDGTVQAGGGRGLVDQGTWADIGLSVVIPEGPCEVLMQGDAPAMANDGLVDDNTLCYFVRAAALRDEAVEESRSVGGSGWVPASQVVEDEGSAGETTGTVAAELEQLCPNGITVCFVTNFADRGSQEFATFMTEGSAFAQAQNAVALSGGQVVTGTVNLIAHKHDIVSILAGIQQALRGPAAQIPAWVRVAHLAFFTHGWATPSDGTGLATGGDGNGEGSLRPEDLEGFAHSLTAFCTSDVNVSLFACSTGARSDENTYESWQQQAEATGGEGSFADELADQLATAGADQARVLGHTTVAHSVHNSAARLYEGGEDGGYNVFNWVMLPVTEWLSTEVAQLGETGLHEEDPATMLGRELFEWFEDTITNDLEPTQLSSRMSSDPEIFRAEVRLRAKAWVQGKLPGWGVIPDGSTVANRYGYSVVPSYLSGEQPSPAPQVPGNELLTVQGYGVQLGGKLQYPITWDDDPTTAQEHLPYDWMAITLPGQ